MPSLDINWALVRKVGREHREEFGGLLPTASDHDRGGFAWDFLRARREINPERFDRWHPVVGPWIRDEPTAPIPPVLPPTVPPTTPPVVTPPTGVVPEAPTAGMIALGLVALLALRRLRSKLS